MRGAEFLRKIEKLARARNLYYIFVPAHGKGSHGRLELAGRSTTLKDRTKEIGPGLLSFMCSQLGIRKEDL